MSSWYLELAAEEGLDAKVVVMALAKALIARRKEAEKQLDAARRLDALRPLLTVKQVAVILGKDEETVRRYARNRVFTSIDIPGGGILFDEKILLEELNRYMRPSKFSD